MAKKAYSPDPKAETIKRIQRTEAYAEKVRQLFAATVNEILALNKSVPTLDEGVMYSFDGYCRTLRDMDCAESPSPMATVMAISISSRSC